MTAIHISAVRKFGRRLPIVALVVLTGFSGSVRAADEASELEIALDLATMLQSARSVIANNQKLINDASLSDKGLTGPIVLAKALENFRKAKGTAIRDISLTSRRGRLLKAQMAAIERVMQENQATINEPGLGFKGFVPAVFARLVNEEFQSSMGHEVEIKVTARPEYIRNRKAYPDAWEIEAIRGKLMASGWKRGKVYSVAAKKRSRDAFRVLVPEYYGKGCLACHGEPKGALDITGYPKEGGKLGELGGVISVTLYRH